MDRKTNNENGGSLNKDKDIFARAARLESENKRLTAENAELRGKECPYVVANGTASHCALAQSEIVSLDAARKVATAAVAVEVTRSAYDLLDMLYWTCPTEIAEAVYESTVEAVDIMDGAEIAARAAFLAAVAEYRKLEDAK